MFMPGRRGVRCVRSVDQFAVKAWRPMLIMRSSATLEASGYSCCGPQGCEEHIEPFGRLTQQRTVRQPGPRLCSHG